MVQQEQDDGQSHCQCVFGRDYDGVSPVEVGHGSLILDFAQSLEDPAKCHWDGNMQDVSELSKRTGDNMILMIKSIIISII